MATIALHLPRPERLGSRTLARFASHASERGVLERLDALVGEILPEARADRIYFGNEFCPHLLPTTEQVRAARAAAGEADCAFTFCAPPMAEGEFARLAPILEALANEGSCEVVFQDWGTLRLLRREFPSLVPVLGRLLNKGLRDPRVTPRYAETVPTGEARAALQAEAGSSSPFLALLRGQGVGRIEADPLPQGGGLRARPGFALSVTLPFGVVTTGRICLAAALGQAREDRFEPVARCGRECQSHLTVFESPAASGFAPVPLFEKGNTYFFPQSEGTMRAAFEAAAAGEVDRLVLQAGIPQWA